MKKTEEITCDFIDKIKQENKKGITQRELAQKYDLPRRTIQLMIKDRFCLEVHRKFMDNKLMNQLLKEIKPLSANQTG